MKSPSTMLILILTLVLSLKTLSSELEILSLLEFKNGIFRDPLGKIHDSWDASSSLDPNGCPSTWHGLTCDLYGNVVSIYLHRLGLQGDLNFSTLTSLKMLCNLTLSGNAFTGRLAPVMGSMNSLRHLDLSNNRFVGSIPAKINLLSNLNYLNLSSNLFTGRFPSGISNLQQLNSLDLHSNGFWGDALSLLSEFQNVETVDMSFNNFTGSIDFGPENILGLANTLHYLNLRHNQLNGEFFKSGSLASFQNLEFLDLGDNQIVGDLPSMRSLRSLRVLRLGNNQLSGSIPGELLEGLIPLEELDLGSNQFIGWIQQINSTTLNILNLSSNGLSGSLPSSLGGSRVADLSRNKISGDISLMQNWDSALEIIDLSSNNLNGSFPNMTSQFSNLSNLKLSSNSLVGKLPQCIGTYPKLSEVDFSSNSLDGSIPHSLFTSLTLKKLNLSGNNFTGQIYFEGLHANELLVISSYPPLECLDLSSNYITGSLPSNIGDMFALTLLNLARNSLSGSIPTEIAKLSGLKHLDLSNNNFSGTIPDMIQSLTTFNVSNNAISGTVPGSLKKFPVSSFCPGNPILIFTNDFGSKQKCSAKAYSNNEKNRRSFNTVLRLAIILASVGATIMILVLLGYHRAHFREFRRRSGFCGQTTKRDDKLLKFTRPSLFKFNENTEVPLSSLSFSNDHLLISNSRSLSGNFGCEIVEHIVPDDDQRRKIIEKKFFLGSPLTSSPRHVDVFDKSVTLDVYSPDRLNGKLFFLDDSLAFTAEQLSRAPAEIMGRNSHGTSYKATIDSGHVLTVKWLRVGLVKNNKKFSKEAKKIGSVKHPNIVSLRAYYWGSREQEILILADHVNGNSLDVHLYGTIPRRCSVLSLTERLKVAVEISEGLVYLHDKGIPHGNLKPTNVLLDGPCLTARLTDFSLHRFMTQTGISEQILNLGALGYRAPELFSNLNPAPSLKADVYSFGVILMELLTRRSAGDIISGQHGAVDLIDWVQLCDLEGRGRDCMDREITGHEEPSKAMYDLLAVSIRCILPANERPHIRQVFEELRSIAF